MNAIKQYTPNVDVNVCVIIFEGVCRLYNVWSEFIIKVDTQHRFKLCGVQSSKGQNILRHFEMPRDHFDTMFYVEGNQCFDKSDAFLNVVIKLGLPWRLLYLFRIISKRLMNWLYDRITLNRYNLFGKYDSCVLPTEGNKNRLLKIKIKLKSILYNKAN